MLTYRWLGIEKYQYIIFCTKEDAAEIISRFGPETKAPTMRSDDGIKYSHYLVNTKDKIITPVRYLSWIFGGHADEPLIGEQCSIAIFLDDYRFVEDPFNEKIPQFFQRIHMDPFTQIKKDVDFLGRVQTNCVLNIAYENLDILENKPLDLTPNALFDKIVVRGRGGYCFELNGLLTHMLREMGFTVSERFARFLLGEAKVPMRRHRVTIVHMPEGDYLCDIGVGLIAPRLPLRIEENTVQTQNGETYRFTRDARHGWILWELHHGQWREYICFSNDEAYDVDFVQPSFFCEKHPSSPFNKEYMLAIKTPTGRRTIDGRCYKIFEGEELVHIEEDVSDERLRSLFAGEFRLTV